jgi:alkanesulfonate monooxygenase SsuD/methylene tetrahydromethanopterin reductase-like flavin-dependent oxidoreductase (luciferase family)
VALADQVLIGPAEVCAAKLADYAAAGVDTVFVWPLGDPVQQLRRFSAQVLPHLP